MIIRNFLMLYSALCILYVAQAQNRKAHFLVSPKTAWALGIKTGMNNATATGHMRSNYSVSDKSGGYVGFVIEKPLSHNWALQPAFYYSAQGYVETSLGDSIIPNDITTKRLLGYLNLPVLLQYITPIGITVQTGPQVAFLIHREEYNMTKNTSLDWVGSVSYVSKIGLGVEAAYIQELRSFNIGNRPQAYSLTRLKHRVFQGGIVYYFVVAKKRSVSR